MKFLRKMVFPGGGDRQPAETRGRIYSRSNTGARPRSAQVQNISNHPIVRILLRIDELQRQDEAGHRINQQAERRRAELEACLAAIRNRRKL